MIYGNESSPLQRLFVKGNRNLRGVAYSDIPETLVNVLAANQKSKVIFKSDYSIGHQSSSD
jgi:hypothetical protein